MSWHLLPVISAPMLFQMALDELLFETQKIEPRPPLLRFYASSGPWISAGCSFRDDVALSRSALVRSHPGVPVCRRITGGGCVMHGEDLIFSLIVRYGGDDGMTQDDTRPARQSSVVGCRLGSYFAAVKTSYEKIHEAVKLGLGSCGLRPEFYRDGDLPKGEDCFDFPVESDLSWKGIKIAGGAQKRSNGILLHHESVRIPRGVRRDDLSRGIRQGFESVFSVRIESAAWDPDLIFRAQQLVIPQGLRTED